MNNHNARANLQSTCKLSQACKSMLVLAKTRQALSLPVRQTQSSPLRNKPTTSGHRKSQIVCPITSSKLSAENDRNNASWSINIHSFQEKLNQTLKINARRPVSQQQSRSSIFEAQDEVIDRQHQPQQQQSSKTFYPSPSVSISNSQFAQELAATNREQQSASSSFYQLSCKKSNRKINSVVLAMMNKKNNILKQFMSQQQNQPANTQKTNPTNFVALSKLIKSNFVQDKDHNSCQNLSQIRPISSESKHTQQQQQSQESLFRLKTTNSQSQLKETIQKQEKQSEKQFSSAGRSIYEFPQRKHRIFMSSERLSWSNSNSSSSTNLFKKSKYNNQSEIMSTTILSRNNSIAQNMISEQLLKIQEISASIKGGQPEEIIQEQYKQPQRDAYNLLRERPYNFLQKTDQFLKQEEEIMQKAAISPQLQKVNFNRRAQSAQYQSRNRFHSSTSNTSNGQINRFINLNNNNSYSSYSLKALRDDGESEKSEQSSLKSWKRQTIIEGGVSVENSIENAVQTDQIEIKDPNPTVSNSLSKIKIIVQKSQGSNDIRSYSSRLEVAPQKTQRAGVFSHPNGVKKSLCGCSFTNAL